MSCCNTPAESPNIWWSSLFAWNAADWASWTGEQQLLHCFLDVTSFISWFLRRCWSVWHICWSCRLHGHQDQQVRSSWIYSRCSWLWDSWVGLLASWWASPFLWDSKGFTKCKLFATGWACSFGSRRSGTLRVSEDACCVASALAQRQGHPFAIYHSWSWWLPCPPSWIIDVDFSWACSWCHFAIWQR